MNQSFLYNSLLRIRNLDDFSAFREWIDEEQQLHLTMLTSSQEDRALYQAQGAYRVLEKLKKLIEESPKLLEKQRPNRGI